jgi:hypothetical protein
MAKERGKTAGGTELASGFISLGVKYGSAMSQVHRDFDSLERQAATAGRRAGTAGGTAVEHGLAQGARRGSRQAAAAIESGEMESAAARAGARIGKIIGTAINAPFHAAGQGFKKLGEEGKGAITAIVPAGGAAVEAVEGVTAAVGGATAGVAGLGIGAAGVMLKIGNDANKLKNQLAWKTGEDGAPLGALMSTIRQASKEVPATFGQIGETAGDLTTNLHLTGGALKTVAEQVTLLKSKMGQEVNIEGLGAMKRALGTDENAIPALLDQLYTASTKSGVGINELIGTLANAAPMLKQMGLDAGQSATFLTQFDEAGVDVNKVMPGMAHAFKDSAKAGEPFGKFVKEQVEQIQKLVAAGDQVGASQLAQKIFGGGIRGGGASILTAIQNGKLNAEELGASEGPGLSILGQERAHETMGDKWQELKNNLADALRPTSQGFAGGITKGLGGAANWAKDELPNALHALGHAVDNTKHAFGNVEHAIVNVEHAFGNIGHAIGNVMHAFGNIGHALHNVFHALGGDILASMGLDILKNAFNLVAGVAKDVWSGLKLLWDVAKIGVDGLGALWNLVKGPVTGAFSGIGHIIQDDVKPVLTEVGHAFGTLLGYVRDFANFIEGLPAKLGNAISGIGDKVGSFLSNLNPFHRAGGGPLDSAPGAVGRDSALFWGAKGEHVLTADDVKAMGGHRGVYAFRRALHRSGGGEVGPDVQAAESMAGTAYSQGARNDCSGMVGRVINAAMGLDGGDLPTTRDMREWLSARGFKTGIGGPGTISVGWYNHGNGPNDGHAAMTLSDGENAESGGSHGNFIVGAGAAGASSSEFDNHMYLPASALYGEGEGGSGGTGGSRGGRGGRGGSGSAAAAQAKVQRADDAYVAATDRLTKARENEAKVDADPKAKQDAKDKAHEQTLKAAQDQTKAAENLQKATEAQRQAAGNGNGGKDSPFGDPMDALGQLGDIGASAVGQNLPDGFWNPLDSSLLKDTSTLLGFFGGLTGNPGLAVAGAAMSGKPSAITGALKGLGQPEFSPLRGAPMPDTQIPKGLTPWNFDPAGPINTAPSAGMGEGGPTGGIGGGEGSMLYASQPPGEKPAKPGKLPFEHHLLAGSGMRHPDGPMGQRGDLGKPANNTNNNVDQSNSHNTVINAPNQDPDQIARQQASAKVAAQRTLTTKRFHMMHV